MSKVTETQGWFVIALLAVIASINAYQLNEYVVAKDRAQQLVAQLQPKAVPAPKPDDKLYQCMMSNKSSDTCFAEEAARMQGHK